MVETITNTTRESHRPEERNGEVLDDANQRQADEDQNDGEHINITIIQC